MQTKSFVCSLALVPLLLQLQLAAGQTTDITPYIMQTIRLEDRRPQNDTIPKLFWRWYEISSSCTRNESYTARELGEDGYMRTVHKVRTVTTTCAVVLNIETKYDKDLQRYGSVNYVVLNQDPEDQSLGGYGTSTDTAWNRIRTQNMPAPPDDGIADTMVNYNTGEVITVWDNNPFPKPCWLTGYSKFYEYNSRGVYNCPQLQPEELIASSFSEHQYGVDSAVITAGMDNTSTYKLQPHLWLGVQCQFGGETVTAVSCNLDVTLLLLRSHLDGTASEENYIGPGDWQWYSLPIGDFDIINITLTRLGTNLTEMNNDGERTWTKKGLRGGIYMGRPDKMQGFPGLQRYEYYASIDYTNLHSNIVLFCTTASQAGDYIIGVHCEDDIPFEHHTYNYITSPPDAVFGDNPLFNFAPAGEELLPANDFAIRWGHYHISFEVKRFEAGLFDNLEVRPGCVSDGQWRYYHIYMPVWMPLASINASKTGMLSTVYTEIRNANVTGLYVQHNSPPTKQAYMGVTQNSNAISVASCSASPGDRWYIGVLLLHNLNATEYNIEIRLENPVKRMTQPNNLVSTRSNGGDGFICCGMYKHYALLDIPENVALNVELNVTKGAIRAIYYKHNGCPTYEQDVQDGECSGFCEITYFSLYNKFNQDWVSHYHDMLQVPYGMDYKLDKRLKGNWMLTVQSQGDIQAEYELAIGGYDLVEKEPPPPCDQQNYLCPRQVDEKPPGWQKQYNRNTFVMSQTQDSAARARRGNISLLWAMMLLHSWAVLHCNAMF